MKNEIDVRNESIVVNNVKQYQMVKKIEIFMLIFKKWVGIDYRCQG